MGKGQRSKSGQTQGARNKAAGNRAERTACRWALEHTSGLHPDVESIATETGRVGNYTNMEIDGVFVEYSLESKSKKRLPDWLVHGIVDQAMKAARRFKNNPLVVIYSKKLPPGFRVWHMITAERHAELLGYESVARRLGGKFDPQTATFSVNGKEIK